MRRPLLEVVDAPDVADAIVMWLAGDGPSVVIAAHTAPVIAAERERAGRGTETLSELVPEAVVTEFTARLARPWTVPADWAEGVVDPAFVRAVLADALADVLEDFVSSLPLAGAAGSLLGSLTRKAGRIKGGKVPFAGQARQFANDAADRLRREIIEAVRSEEHKDELARTLERGAAAVLGLETATALAQIDDPGPEVVASWLSTLLAHNLARPELADAIRTQIVTGLQREAAVAPTLGDWLDRLGLTEHVTAPALDLLTRRVRSLAGADAFEKWLAALLAEAMDAD